MPLRLYRDRQRYLNCARVESFVPGAQMCSMQQPFSVIIVSIWPRQPTDLFQICLLRVCQNITNERIAAIMWICTIEQIAIFWIIRWPYKPILEHAYIFTHSYTS